MKTAAEALAAGKPNECLTYNTIDGWGWADCVPACNDKNNLCSVKKVYSTGPSDYGKTLTVSSPGPIEIQISQPDFAPLEKKMKGLVFIDVAIVIMLMALLVIVRNK